MTTTLLKNMQPHQLAAGREPFIPIEFLTPLKDKMMQLGATGAFIIGVEALPEGMIVPLNERDVFPGAIVFVVLPRGEELDEMRETMNPTEPVFMHPQGVRIFQPTIKSPGIVKWTELQ